VAEQGANVQWRIKGGALRWCFKVADRVVDYSGRPRAAYLVRESKKHVCVSCLRMVCLQLKRSFVEYKFFNMGWRILILYAENSTFGIIMSWSSQVVSGRVIVCL